MRWSASQSGCRETLRGEVGGGAVGGRGEGRQGPVEVGPGVDLVQLAGGDYRIDDGGVVAGVGVADEEPVAEAELGRANLALYSEMAITPSSLRGGMSPPSVQSVIGVVVARGYATDSRNASSLEGSSRPARLGALGSVSRRRQAAFISRSASM